MAQTWQVNATKRMPKEVLVMLPGMMCDERLFAPQISTFERDYHIFVPKLDRENSIEGMAQRILNEIKAPTFNLMGLSMGGIVAMSIVGLAPQRVSRLALLDTNHMADAAERFALRNRQIEDVKTGRLHNVITTEMKPNYLAKANRKNGALLDILTTMALDLGDDTFISQSIALRDRVDQTEALVTFKGPTLVLCGDEDFLCTPEQHAQMAKLLFGSVFHQIKNAGHVSTLEQPNTVNEVLKAWLNLHIEAIIR
jgi:pimeloyl-ACP methyl ester carboxylesterase